MAIIIIPYAVCLYMEAAPNNLGYIIKNSNGLELTVASTSNGVVLQMVVKHCELYVLLTIPLLAIL